MKRSKSYFATANLILIFALCITWVSPTFGQPAFTEGANVLFAGHSFFGPVSRNFDYVAAQNNFPDHVFNSVQRGGANGSPASLWDDTDGSRTDIEAVLATGQVELFGLTAYSENDSTVQDYVRWFNLAKSYNPETSFFIGIPWVTHGPGTDSMIFEDLIVQTGEKMFETISILRNIYPDTPIYFLNYGRTSSIMKYQFEAGQLPDIDDLVGSDERALFTDNFGHAGPMMVELSALAWMEILYGADVTELDFTPYQSDAVGIVQDVVAFNAPYQSARLSVGADSIDVLRGNLISGGLQELDRSDNQDVSLRRSNSDVVGTIEVEISGTSPYLNPAAAALTVESSGFFRSEILQTVEAWNFENETWVHLDTRPLTQFGDMEVTLASSGNVSKYVDQNTGEFLTRVRYTTASSRQSYGIGIDRLTWTFE
ncbi:MAG: hypothetical protein AAF456_01795 [Planctomycetota bacterium]